MERHTCRLPLFLAPLVLLLFAVGARSQSAPPSDPTLEALDKAQREGRLADAEKLLNAAIRDASERAPVSARLSLLLNRQASLAMHQGRYSDAVAAGKRVLAIDEKLFGSESPRVVAELSNLALYYDAAGENAAAEQSFHRALAIARNDPGPRLKSLLLVLNNLSSFYIRHERAANAEPLLVEALRACDAQPGPEPPLSCAGFRRSLATAYRSEGKRRDAEEIAADAVAESPASGRHWRDEVVDLETLAQQYEADDSYDLAETTYRQAVARIEKELGPDDPYFLATQLENLGELLEKEGRNAEAEDLFKRALDLRERAAGPKHPDLAASLNFDRLGNLYRTQGRLSELEPMLQQGLALQERVLGPRHVAVSVTLLRLATLYEEEQKYRDAEPLYPRALEIQQANLGPDDSRLLSTLEPYAALLRLLGEQDEAEEIAARAAALRQKLAKQNSK